MIRRRTCAVCRKRFAPDPRAADRQRVCSDPACQKERHRRDCLKWRTKNPQGKPRTFPKASPTIALSPEALQWFFEIKVESRAGFPRGTRWSFRIR